ncbi:MAG: EAL domain-containing protein, partial [Pyrinomonadaceae bacterium]
NLGIEVVAEGIETEQQLEMLRSLGCRLGQGYLFSRPVGAIGVEQLLRDAPEKFDFDRLPKPICIEGIIDASVMDRVN